MYVDKLVCDDEYGIANEGGALVGAELDEADVKNKHATYMSKLWRVTQLALPAIACCYATMGQELINLIFIGHYGDDAMVAGVGMGNTIQNMIGLSTMIGINSALDTLVS